MCGIALSLAGHPIGSSHLPTPTRRQARPPVTNYGYGIPSREPTAELRPISVRGSSGGPGVYDRMERGHSGIAKGVKDLGLAIGARPPILRGAEDETPVEAAFRETLQRAAIDAVFVDAENGIRGWHSLGAHLAQYYTRGAFLGARRFVADRSARYPGAPILNGLAIEVYPISLSSVANWKAEQETQQLIGITQQTSTGQREIDVDDLVHLQHGGAIGEWEGVSILRSLVFPFERWASIFLASEQGSRLDGGLLVYQQPLGNETNSDVALAFLDTLGLEYIALPPNANPGSLELLATTGTKSAPADLMRYVDEQVNTVFDAAVQSLVSSQHGSRAVGEELGEDADEAQQAALIVLLRGYVSSVGAWLARQIGYLGRMPDVSLTADSVATLAEQIDILGPAVTTGLLTWTQQDEAQIREGLGLAPREVVTEARVLNGAQITAALAVVAGMTPVDPLQTPTAPGAALELLVASGVPLESARSIINAQLVGMGQPPLPEPKPVAQPNEATFGDSAATVTVIGADGLPYESSCELSDVEVHVEWATIDNQRAKLDDELTAEIERLAAIHRDATANALRDGWQPGERESVWQTAKNAYLAAITAYRDATQAVVAEHAGREMQRQVAAGVPRVEPGQGTATPVAPSVNVSARAILAAETIADRVQGELENAWAAGQALSAFVSRITAKGLSAGARAVGTEVESTGRITAARDLAQSRGGDGLVVTGVIRSSVRDRNRCEHCANMHGVTFSLPQEQDRFDRMPIPDPDCEGRAERCRCGWLIKWGRR